MLKNRVAEFGAWWQAPNTKKDRITGAIIGAISGFWIGAFARIILGELPVSITIVGLWALGGIILFSLLGAAFPKVISCFCFPFSIFGVGN